MPVTDAGYDGGEAPATGVHGPVTLVADINVPCDQESVRVVPERLAPRLTLKSGTFVGPGRFGCGYFFGDPDFAGSINELRIYTGVLTANDVLNDFNAGPDTVVPLGSIPQVNIAATLSGNQLVLSWPYGTLEQANDLNGPWVPLASAKSPYMPGISGSKMFYRVRLN